MDQRQMLQIVEEYSRQSDPEFGEIKVIRVADQKTVNFEQIGEGGRSIVMTEYKVNGKVY